MNKVLKARIIEKFGTQADFAQKIKTDESTISRVVRGRRNLEIKERKKWARALGCRAEDLFSR